MINIKIAKNNWEYIADDSYSLFCSRSLVINNIYKFIAKMYEFDLNKILDYIKNVSGSFSIIIKSDSFIFCCVDRVNSIPIYFSPVCIFDSKSLPQFSVYSLSSIENYLMLGYMAGDETLNENIKKLEAGQYLYQEKNKSILINEYYEYYPTNISTNSYENLLDSFEELNDTLYENIIQDASGRQIVVPLSGGLDSRLVLSKIVEKKYDNLLVFTYGVNGSHEAKMAKEVCKKLGVKWNFLPFKNTSMNSSDFIDFVYCYLSYCPLISNTVSIMELFGFYSLYQKNILQSDSLVVNGQSGDFIVGAHIRVDLIGGETKDNVFNYIIKKHYSLWPILLNEERVANIKQMLDKQYCLLEQKYNDLRPYHFYEYWEWKERQSKWVINGQRLYDSLGLGWSLPFWDARMMEFWQNCPIQYKINQKLYIDYLKRYNYRGVFDTLRYPPDPWAGKYRAIKLSAQLLGLIVGHKQKQKYYKYMDYYSTYSDQYHLYGRELYKKYWKYIRGPISLSTLYALDRLGLGKQAREVLDKAIMCESVS